MIDTTRTTSFGTAASDGPIVYPATGERSPRSPWRLTAIALGLALLLGTLGGGWIFSRFFNGPTDTALATTAQETTKNSGAPNVAAPPSPAPVAPLGPRDAAGLSARIALLEERLARISLAANSASGNAAKAESILVAFAARRSIDRGLGLGAMEAQLRLRFGETQPNAVRSILSAAARPVLQEELIQRLYALRATVLTDANAGWMARVGNSLSSLIVIRSADAPSQIPQRRYERAQRALSTGQLDAAIVEVGAMPGGSDPLVQAWLNDARRLNDAQRALDLIEAAAIIEPGENRDASVQ